MFTIWSLNGARFAGTSPGEVSPTLRWLQGLALPGAELPDVLCLQDFRASLIEHLRPLPYFSYAPMTNHMYWGKREALGICIASRWPLTHVDLHRTWGSPLVRDLEGVDEQNRRISPASLSDELVAQTENRVGLACTVIKPGEKEPLRVATHHGFWTRDGIPSRDQLESAESMADFLGEQGRLHGGIVYLADYNPDKEGLVHEIYRKSGAHDCLPQEIRTTLAPNHPAARFNVRSDCVLTFPDAAGNYPYRVENIQLDPRPGSDHYMLRCTILRKESARKASPLLATQAKLHRPQGPRVVLP